MSTFSLTPQQRQWVIELYTALDVTTAELSTLILWQNTVTDWLENLQQGSDVDLIVAWQSLMEVPQGAGEANLSRWRGIRQWWQDWAKSPPLPEVPVHYSVVTYWDQEYPAALRNIEQPPPVLWFSAVRPPVLPPHVLAVVGSRQMTPYGRRATEYFLKELVQKWGCLIVSGCAYGIDTTAHLSALRNGGETWGVWAAGLQQVPRRVEQVFHQSPQATLLTEFPPASVVRKWNFPRRNRLIAGLAQGVLVVEAQLQSGTMITAADALSQGKEVFVVSQPFMSANASGICRLVERGAHLVHQPDQIAEALFQISTPERLWSPEPLLEHARSPLEQHLLSQLWESDGELLALECQNRCGHQDSLEEWSAAVIDLELRGVVKQELGVLRLTHQV